MSGFARSPQKQPGRARATRGEAPRIWTALVGLVLAAGCAGLPAHERPPVPERATLPLPFCQEAMNQAGYWIERLDQPDRVLLSPRDIEGLNRDTLDRRLLTDVFSGRLWDYTCQETDNPEDANPDRQWKPRAGLQPAPGWVQGYTLYTYLKDETERIKQVTRWDEHGEPVSSQRFAELDALLHLESIRDDNPVRYGLTRRRTNVRYFPTDQIITGRRWDTDFDILQVSSVRALEPVAIVHESRDRAWVFAVTPFCRGWIRREDVVDHCRLDRIREVLQPERSLVVIAPWVDVVEAPGATTVAERLTLGTSCPLLDRDGDYYRIGLPDERPEGGVRVRTFYVAAGPEVHEGFVPCTPRWIYTLAFGLLHTPYSWGGRDGTWDCSQLVMDLYATTGLRLPRNSSVQALVGKRQQTVPRDTTDEDRRAMLSTLSGPAFLQFPGHVMLWLGMVDGRPYVLHTIWAYRKALAPGQPEDAKVIIGQVVVSDLSLGEGSARGSLLERLTTITRLQP